VTTPISGADGASGCALIVAPVEVAELQPEDVSVTVKV